MGGVAGSSAFRADGCGCGSVFARRAFVPATGSVLGAHYIRGDHAVVAGCGAHGFLATLCRDAPGSGRGCDWGELLWAARPCIRYLRIPPGAGLRRGARGPKCIPVWRHHAGDRAVNTADGPCMADRISSICRSVYWNCGGTDLRVGVAGEGTHILGENMSSSFIPSERMRHGQEEGSGLAGGCSGRSWG